MRAFPVRIFPTVQQLLCCSTVDATWDKFLTRSVGRAPSLQSDDLVAVAKVGKAGWYISPFSNGWTIGRQGGDGQNYHAIGPRDEPLEFDTIDEARQYLAEVFAAAKRVWPMRVEVRTPVPTWVRVSPFFG